MELMSNDENAGSIQDVKEGERACPIFGVESGGPLIGLGILLIFFAVIPVFIIKVPLPVPAAFLFTGFGIFLIWAGITK
jgi:hypothetical protein